MFRFFEYNYDNTQPILMAVQLINRIEKKNSLMIDFTDNFLDEVFLIHYQTFAILRNSVCVTN